MTPSWPADGRYVFGALGAWVLFLASVFGVAAGRSAGWPVPVLLALACISAALVALQFIAAYRLITAQDEFVRALTVKRIVVAAALTLTLATGWSVMEPAGLPHLPAWLVYPLFWGLFGLVTPVIRDARA